MNVGIPVVDLRNKLTDNQLGLGRMVKRLKSLWTGTLTPGSLQRPTGTHVVVAPAQNVNA